MRQISGTSILSLVDDQNGLCVIGISSAITIAGLITTASIFVPGARIIDRSTGTIFKNTGTTAVPVWSNENSFRAVVASLTATADGLTTGLIPSGTTFVNATSAGATNAFTLPAISAASIGQTIDIYVGANGYELLTPATSNNTINTVDSDGTNQLDVAANTLLRCIQVSATGWVCYQVAATTITVVAPDND